MSFVRVARMAFGQSDVGGAVLWLIAASVRRQPRDPGGLLGAFNSLRQFSVFLTFSRGFDVWNHLPG